MQTRECGRLTDESIDEPINISIVSGCDGERAARSEELVVELVPSKPTYGIHI